MHLMKTLSETQILAGQTETITVMDLRKLPGEVFNQVEMGKIYQITRKGKVIAKISPVVDLISTSGSAAVPAAAPRVPLGASASPPLKPSSKQKTFPIGRVP